MMHRFSVLQKQIIMTNLYRNRFEILALNITLIYRFMNENAITRQYETFTSKTSKRKPGVIFFGFQFLSYLFSTVNKMYEI